MSYFLICDTNCEACQKIQYPCCSHHGVPNIDYFCLQDRYHGSLNHRNNITGSHLESNIPEFIRKNGWIPQTPDLSPMNYHVWISVSEEVNHGWNAKFTEDELKRKKSGILDKSFRMKLRKQQGLGKSDSVLSFNRIEDTMITFLSDPFITLFYSTFGYRRFWVVFCFLR